VNQGPVGSILRINALAACDGTGFVCAPASILAQRLATPSLRLLAVGPPREIDAHPAATTALPVHLPASIVTPAFVNAHTHLDLTHIGPTPHDPDSGFVSWVNLVRTARHSEPEHIAASVRRGIELSRAGGVAAVGDIAGAPAGIPNLTPYRTLAKAGFEGCSFLEFFGIGTTIDKCRQVVNQLLSETVGYACRTRIGLQPHAPNTVDIRLYQWAAALAQSRRLPISTHLSETQEEAQFVASGNGPQRTFLERIGIWHDSILEHIGHGKNPVAHLAPVLSAAPFLVAHVNSADDAAIETLARSGTSVAYCPRASAYFGAERHFGAHRYREMLSAGINVALGTDSIINLDTADRISPLDDARLLYQRDRTDPLVLLRMLTLNGARAIGVDTARFTLELGETSGLVAVEAGGTIPGANPHPFAVALQSGSMPVLL
jgi:cytosine/adenosine deaminase-related metal-dependent hydrolase